MIVETKEDVVSASAIDDGNDHVEFIRLFQFLMTSKEFE